MTSRVHRAFLFSALAASGLALGACQSDKHTMVEARPGMTVVCQHCYDESVKMTHTYGSRSNATYEQTHKTHQCPCCKTEMSTYVENGVPKVKCGGCVPEGVACDKCLPPGPYSRWTR